MTITRGLRSVAWASAFLLAAVSFSCDALNPELVGQLGGDAGNAGPAPTGSIVLLFNNQTAQVLSLRYNVEFIRPGESAVLQQDSTATVSQGYFATTYDCDTSAIILNDIVAEGGEDDNTLPLSVSELRRPALQCGSVVFVNVPLLGSPTVDLLP